MSTPSGPTGWDVRVPDRVPTGTMADAPHRVDLLVVGLGASGLEAAGHAARRGAAVLAVDRSGIAAGAAGRNGGFLLAGLADFHHDAARRHGRATAVDWYHLTERELDRTADRFPTLVRRTGSLRIAASGDERLDIERQVLAMQVDAIAVEPYDGPEGVGLLVPGDAVVNPVARCHALAAEATTAGAVLVAPADVVDLVPHDPDVVAELHAGGSVEHVVAGAVVVAVDGGLERLLPELAGRVRTATLEMLSTAPDTAVSLPRPVYRRWGYDYVQQLPTGEVLLGGGRDTTADAGWDAPANPTSMVQGHLDAWMRALGVEAPVTHRWAAHAAFTPNRLPIAEEVRPGVHAVGGHSGHGNLLGPLLARQAVDHALDRRPTPH